MKELHIDVMNLLGLEQLHLNHRVIYGKKKYFHYL